MEDDIIWTHLREVLERFGQYFINTARNNLLADGSNATGTLTNSMEYNVEIDNAHYQVTVTLEDYWYYVENGRKAGKMPPVDKIRDWVIAKRIQPPLPSVHSLAIAIGKSIEKKKGYFPNVGALENWVEAKGLNNTPMSVDSLAWAIAKKIEREGTQGTGFFEKARKATMEYFQESISDAIREDIGDFVTDVLANNKIF